MVCNEILAVCVPSQIDACNNACIAPQVCNPNTKLCETPAQVDACNNACIAPQVCNPNTKLCENPAQVDACNNTCIAPQVCNPDTKQCENPAQPDACNNTCIAPQVCNPDTKQCETPAQPDACNNSCIAPQVCNPDKKKCEDPDQPDACNNACIAPQVCNPDTKKCENPDQPDACNNTCVAPQVCNPDTKKCEDPAQPDACNNACIAPQVCNPDTKKCETPAQPDACNNACVAPQVCNPDSKKCEDPAQPDACNNACIAPQKCDEQKKACVDCLSAADCTDKPNGSCNDGVCSYKEENSKCKDGCKANEACNENTGKCFIITSCKGGFGTCQNEGEPCTSSTDAVCTAGYCVHPGCLEKTWDPEYQGCNLTKGELFLCDGRCNADKDCPEDLPSCDTKAHKCVAACESDPEDNLIPNWSFEEWDNTLPDNWSLHNNYNATASTMKSDDAAICNASVKFINQSKDNARLESDPIMIPEVNYTANSDPAVQLECSIHYKGTAKLNIGYRALDEEGKTVKEKTTIVETNVSSDSWKTITFPSGEFGGKLNPPMSASTFQVLIGISDTTDKGLLLDGMECVVTEGICEGITCKEWEICSLSGKNTGNGYVGVCKPRTGYCSITEDKPEQGTCANTEICDETTHTCKRVDGKCDSHKDCTDDAKPYCNKSTHECGEGNVCENAKCSEWRECTTASRGTCIMKEGRCQTSADCPADKPACYGKEHLCVAPDFTYSVDKQKDCHISKEYFEYLNKDENGNFKSELVCPINIIPNGSFEDWYVHKFTENSTPHDMPTWWPALDDYDNYFTVAPYKYITKLSLDAVHPYTKSAYHGQKALQLVYTGQGGNNRFTSWGFTVPSGPWDCSYWVRGKGHVKIHTYSSLGDAPATSYVSYDTNEWQRATFQLNEKSATAARLVIYVSHTDASKDHIQIDNIVCTAKGSVI